MKLLFAGDYNLQDFKYVRFSEELNRLISENDLRLINLEGPLYSSEISIMKKGPSVCNPVGTMDFLVSNGFNLFALANNHIMDYGSEGLSNTIDVLEKSGKGYFGAGKCVKEAYMSYDYENVSIINGCQAEFGVLKSGIDGFGYAWINSPMIDKMIIEKKRQNKIVIVYAHSGLEGVFGPLPEWRERYRALIDIGADMVVAAHPHTIQGIEEYKGKKIYYSLGNFCFDSSDDFSSKWNNGMIVTFDTLTMRSQYHLVRFEKGILRVVDDESAILMEKPQSLIDNPKLYKSYIKRLVDVFWEKYYKNYYLSAMPVCGKDVFDKIVSVILGRKFDRRVDETFLLHNIQIESHRWCVERYLYFRNMNVNGLIEENNE